MNHASKRTNASYNQRDPCAHLRPLHDAVAAVHVLAGVGLSEWAVGVLKADFAQIISLLLIFERKCMFKDFLVI